MEEQSSIFRKQSLERVSSPEQLNDYIKAANPNVWFALSAILVLLVALCLWGIFGRLETAINTSAMVSGGTLSVYIPEKYGDEARDSLPLLVSIDGSEYRLSEVSEAPVMLGEETDPYAVYTGGYKTGDFVFIAKASSELPDGVYNAVLILGSVAPVFFVTN